MDVDGETEFGVPVDERQTRLDERQNRWSFSGSSHMSNWNGSLFKAVS